MKLIETCPCGATFTLEDVQWTEVAMANAKLWREDHQKYCIGIARNDVWAFDEAKYTPENLEER